MLCLGKSVAVLVAARALQGLSAAIVWVVGLALIADTCGPADAGRSMGYVSLAFSFGTLIAPLLGGVVYARAGYFAVYGMCFGVVGLDVIMRLVLIEKKVAARWARETEAPRQVLQKKDDINLEQRAESSQARTTSPALDEVPQGTATPRRRPTLFILLSSQRVLAAAWATVVCGVLLSAFDATLPLFVHRTFGWNSTGSGLIFLALVVPTFSGPIFGTGSI
jgi:MFS family permease